MLDDRLEDSWQRCGFSYMTNSGHQRFSACYPLASLLITESGIMISAPMSEVKTIKFKDVSKIVFVRLPWRQLVVKFEHCDLNFSAFIDPRGNTKIFEAMRRCWNGTYEYRVSHWGWQNW